MRISIYTLGLIGALQAWTGSAVAQQRELPVSQRSCHGMFTAELASGHAHVDFDQCGEYLIPAVSDAVRRLKTEGRASRRVDRVLVYALNIRSPEIFNAALEVADDASGTAYGRITAMMIVVAQHDNAILIGGVRGFRHVYTVPLGERCPYDLLTDRGYRLEQPMPADYRIRAAKTLRRVHTSAQESLLVRRFAACTERIFERSP